MAPLTIMPMLWLPAPVGGPSDGLILFDTYQASGAGPARVYTYNPTTGVRTLLRTEAGISLAGPVWSRDHSKFVEMRYNTSWALIASTTHAASGAKIADTAAASYASFKPDGTMVYQGASNVLSGVPSTPTGFAPDVSADGQWFAYVSSVSSVHDALWKIKADGTGRTRLTAAGAATYSPRWSPDGTKIAYSPAGQRAVRVMDADGANDHQVWSHATTFVYFLDWSPVGDRLVLACSDTTLRMIYLDGSSAGNVPLAADGGLINCVSWH